MTTPLAHPPRTLGERLGDDTGLAYWRFGAEVWSHDGVYWRQFCSWRAWGATTTCRRIAGAADRARREQERAERAVREACRPVRRRAS